MSENQVPTPEGDMFHYENYTRSLYHHLLGREPAESEVVYWTTEASRHKDPGWLLKMFIESKEYNTIVSSNRSCASEFPNGHFYSPVVSREEVRQHQGRIFSPRPLVGIMLHQEGQRKLFDEIMPYFSSFPSNETKVDGRRYYLQNTSYNFGDAIIYWGMLGLIRPRKIIEIGCGFTSGLALDAIEYFDLKTKCLFVDPHPELAQKLIEPLSAPHEILGKQVQDVSLNLFRELVDGDLLFIDSSHIVKTGSDVAFEVLEILPILHPGVWVHFHDVFFPFEYPREWILSNNKSWNELYFLHSFLMFNAEYEIMYFNDYFAKEQMSNVDGLDPQLAQRIKVNPGGGLWLRRSS